MRIRSFELNDAIANLEEALRVECEQHDCTKDVKRSPRSARVELVEQALFALREAAKL